MNVHSDLSGLYLHIHGHPLIKQIANRHGRAVLRQVRFDMEHLPVGVEPHEAERHNCGEHAAFGKLKIDPDAAGCAAALQARAAFAIAVVFAVATVGRDFLVPCTDLHQPRPGVVGPRASLCGS